ncbi:DUF447 domain-containing protein [Halolamina sediminis]|jgi:hypothetical protein|uniref:DUF447 domain-containing protein n=1 Tax=Halolamina sediminis TaxID=1480675 RepID=UPI0006B481DE|nr:DUF447 domain-containing protein [Halolamina sediminis]
MTGAGGGWAPEDDAPDGWPVPLRGVTESVIATKGPNDLWNLAALGLHAGDPVTARTYGNTRTRRNFERRGGGVVQFVADPRPFVDAALSIREEPEPVLPSADAWIGVDAALLDTWTEGETTIREWELTPGESEVVREEATTINRGFGAVVEATVAASRLGVAGFDDEELRGRLDFLTGVAERCGGAREREAVSRIEEYADWDRPEN